MGHVRYLSCLKYVDAVIGNSSSRIIEAPSFKKATINIGDRQRGRLRAESVIDCDNTKRSILSAISTLYTDDFQARLESLENPYGSGGASKKIVTYLEQQTKFIDIKKQFHNINIS